MYVCDPVCAFVCLFASHREKKERKEGIGVQFTLILVVGPAVGISVQCWLLLFQAKGIPGPHEKECALNVFAFLLSLFPSTPFWNLLPE